MAHQHHTGLRSSRSPFRHSSRRDEARRPKQPHTGPRRSRSPFRHSSRRDEARRPKQPHTGPRRSRSPFRHSSRRDESRTRNQPYTRSRRSRSLSAHSSRRDEARRPKQPHTGPRRSRSPFPHSSRRDEARTPKQPRTGLKRSRSPSSITRARPPSVANLVGAYSTASKERLVYKDNNTSQSTLELLTSEAADRHIDQIFCWQLAHFVGGLHMREGESNATESAIQSIACVSVDNHTADELRTRGTAWAVGPDLLVTSFHTLSHDHHTVRDLYISHPLDPSMKLFGLETVGVSKFLDLALLRCTETTFHRVAVEELVEPYEKIYHVESLDIDYPVVHTSTFVPSGNELFAHSVGPSDTGFSGGPVMNRRGRCVGVFKGAYSPNELTKKVFVTAYALRLFLEQVASEINPDLRYFEAMRVKKWFSVPRMVKETKAKGGVIEDCAQYWGEGTAETVPVSSLDCTWAKKTVIADSPRW